MGSRGPKGEQAENVTSLGLVVKERPKPPKGMPQVARKIWKEIVGSKPVDFFQKAELPLLVKYCMAEHFYWKAIEKMSEDLCIITERGFAFPDMYLTIANKQVLLQNALATKLRIATNSRVSNHKAAGEKETPPAKRRGLMFGGDK